MLNAFSATIEKIYAAASGSGRWDEALHAIEDLTGSAGVVIHLIDRHDTAESGMLLSKRIRNHFDDAALDEWTRDLMPHCPRLAAGIAHPDAPVVVDYMILSEAEMDRNPVYEWYGRHGLRYFIGSPLGETPRHKLMWSLQRTPAQGHVQQVDAECFELIKPHVRCALGLADQIGTLRSCQRFGSALIEAIPQAVFALDEGGRLVFANGAGQRLLRSADGLFDVDGHLMAASRDEQACLVKLIRDAIDPLDTAASGWARISRPSGKRPFAVFASPLIGADGEFPAAEARVLVVVHDTGARQVVDKAMLKSIYGLTDTEARLAAALAEGHSIESAACLLGVQPATTRTHLKSVFNKLGVHRQQDLTRLLASLSTIRPFD